MKQPSELETISMHLEEHLRVINERVGNMLTEVLQQHPDKILRDEVGLENAPTDMLCAALLEICESLGPNGSRLSYYLNRYDGPEPVRKKKRIEHYRAILHKSQ